MQYLRTTLATDHKPQSFGERITRALLFFIPVASPDYEAKLHLVREWLIEFDDEGRPDREIGLAATGSPIVAGPDARNYGFWLDTDMLFKDFSGSPITSEQFEATWKLSQSKNGSTNVVPVA